MGRLSVGTLTLIAQLNVVWCFMELAMNSSRLIFLHTQKLHFVVFKLPPIPP